MYLREKFRSLLDNIPYVKQLHKEIHRLNKTSCYPPGHFYSPIVSPSAVKSRESEIWNDKVDTIEGVDLNTESQLSLFKELSAYYNEMPFREKQQAPQRFYFDNAWYSYTDAILLYSMIRHFRPKRIVEIGSGFSSSLMLDTNEIFFNGEIELTFIEPNAQRLHSLLKEADKKSSLIIEQEVQDVSKDYFLKLQKGDFLFVDSSHVAKTGSDLNHILFSILPELKPGVIIHFHDIFYPFEYPKAWVYEGRHWNENYFLRAFLMYNTNFEILFFSDFINKKYNDAFACMPLCYKCAGGNFWMAKRNNALS
jgi:predicted O-methyltransferase YrrM